MTDAPHSRRLPEPTEPTERTVRNLRSGDLLVS